ncbi:efflux RND transporter periplasmic adaptor subunit [Stieleria sp. TO1_6]|uniref:efflux RND transporter periplasmic adaptor subunit n=1 Tax=Stieleria tagensis TaxID=2956795 RepID=UPI00209B823A|nr:efflux RND transporter periplasmic adaptor subunit [Stieleria tagensis]MCO8121376.1 efflux RND transporter periplasmic adaptor subunit [Stieleria tagensis]
MAQTIVTGNCAPGNGLQDLDSLVSAFDPAQTIEDAHRILLSQLDRILSADVVVCFESGRSVVEAELTSLRSRLPPQATTADTVTTESPLTHQLTMLCQRSAGSGRLERRQQLMPRRMLLAFPVETSTTDHNAIGLIVSGTEPSVDAIADVLVLVAQFSIWRIRRDLKRQTDLASDAAAIVELLQQSLVASGARAVSQVIVSELADYLDLRRAAIGLRASEASPCRLVSLSDATRIDVTAALTRDYENAIDESLMFDQIVVATEDDESSAGTQAATQLARQLSATIVVVPLRDQCRSVCGGLIAVIEPGVAVESTQRFFSAAQPSLGELLSASLRSRNATVIGRAIKRIRSNAGLVSLAALATLVLALLMPVPHRESCDVRIEPSQRRFVSAPFDAILQECTVEPGDIVQQGDVLAKLDGRELTWKRDALQADFEQSVKKRNAAQASGAYADQRIAQLESDRLQSELNLLDHRLGELELRSPVAGMVVTGDLKRVRGAPLTTGQTLFEVAPLDRMLVEAAVTEEQVALIDLGQSVTLRLNAYPHLSWVSRVRQISPRSEIRDNENVFVADCELENDTGLLRPGMKGSVKIDCGTRRLGWIVLHRAWDAVVTALWW